eukprot:1325812-Amorphochlora_amoeboformis.AAC.2
MKSPRFWSIPRALVGQETSSPAGTKQTLTTNFMVLDNSSDTTKSRQLHLIAQWIQKITDKGDEKHHASRSTVDYSCDFLSDIWKADKLLQILAFGPVGLGDALEKFGGKGMKTSAKIISDCGWSRIGFANIAFSINPSFVRFLSKLQAYINLIFQPADFLGWVSRSSAGTISDERTNLLDRFACGCWLFVEMLELVITILVLHNMNNLSLSEHAWRRNTNMTAITSATQRRVKRARTSR